MKINLVYNWFFVKVPKGTDIHKKITNYMTPTPYPQKWIIRLLLKNSRIRNMRQISRSLTSPLFHVSIINVWWSLCYGKCINERWSLFYQSFEITSQLATLFPFLKLLNFSPADFGVRVSWTSCACFLSFCFSYTIFDTPWFPLLSFIFLWTYIFP